jgi:hypothetical protein
MDAAVVRPSRLRLLFTSRRFGFGGELASGAHALDQAAPSLVAAIVGGDLTPTRKRAITSPVCECPLPRLPLKIAAHSASSSGLRWIRTRARTRGTCWPGAIPQPRHLCSRLAALWFATPSSAATDLTHKLGLTRFDGLIMTRFSGLACRETLGARLSERISQCQDRIRRSSGAVPLIWSSLDALSVMLPRRWGSPSRACTGGGTVIWSIVA